MLTTFPIARRGAHLLVALSGLTLLGHAAPAAAEQQTLRFRLVVQQVGQPSTLPEIGGHKLGAGQYMGVAVFEDGRIAHKRFVETGDDTDQAGTFKGYSTYTFVKDGSLTLSYTGEWDSSGLRGDYQVLSGTGKFAGAAGTGSFKGLDEPWEEAFLLEGSFNLTLGTQ
jgi:hypothetical protein